MEALPYAAGSVQYYLSQITQYEREFKKWEGRAEKIVKRYKDEGREARNSNARFNILWSNVQTMKAATFARLPKPDVSRRFKDNDPVGRVAAMLIERALEFEVAHYQDFHDSLKHAVYDRFLGGRGCAWVRYEPTFTGGATENEEDESQITEDEEFAVHEELEFEAAPTDYVHWRDYGHSVARTWEEVTCVWRKVYLTRSACDARFPEWEGKIPLDSSPQDKSSKIDPDSVTSRALIYEIWCKETGKAYWLSKSLNKFVDEKDDPLELEGFFPCPRPLYATVTNDSLVPTPDFALYQDQANQLDLLADRIDGLVKALQIRGVYDSSEPTLARLFSEGTNTALIPVKNWMAFAEKQGLKGAIDIVDISPIASALNEAYAAFAQCKQQIFEICGMSDFMRGDTNPNETATAQNLKQQYGGLRLKAYQDEVARFATDMLRLKAQIICKHFDDNTIVQMGGGMQLSQPDQQLIPMALQLLRDNPLRTFRIEVSADSMIMMDEQQEKQDRMEFLQATSQFIEKLVQAGQMSPQVLPLGVEMLKFGVTGFRVGKAMEGVIDQVADQIKQQAAQPQQPPPNPDVIKAQAAQQQQQAQLQHEQQLEQFRAQMDAQKEQQKAQIDAQLSQQDQQTKLQIEQMRHEHEAQLEQYRIESQQSFDKWKAELDASTKIAVAEISAQSAMDQTLAKAEQTANQNIAEDVGVEEKPDLADLHAQTLGAIQSLVEQMAKPKTVLRGPDGRVTGVQ